MNEILVPIAIILSLGVDILVIIALISLIRFLHKKS
ncbi:hypothetical protein B5785_0664 [Bifidobacterium longum subsp. infantis]|nr:hypothetical protein B5785_0664 [Bifidobacterium longum subsp. infantis]